MGSLWQKSPIYVQFKLKRVQKKCFFLENRFQGGVKNDFCQVKRHITKPDIVPSDLQLPLRQWGTSNVHLLVLSKTERSTLPKTPLP